MGSSRDWAAKGTQLLGIKAVIAESFERIHQSNLVGMGVLPLQFKEGENSASLRLTGEGSIDILGIENIEPRSKLTVNVKGENNQVKSFKVIVRFDTPTDLKYYQNGGILHTVLREILKNNSN